MKDKIKKLLEDHKLYKLECQYLMNELDKISLEKITKEEAEKMKIGIEKLDLEIELRAGFINDLENLI